MLAKTNLKVIEPFLRGIFSQIDGTLSGDYLISGNFNEPIINGKGLSPYFAAMLLVAKATSATAP